MFLNQAKITKKGLSASLFACLLGILWIDSTYSIPFYAGIVAGNEKLAFTFFIVVHITKLKSYSTLTKHKLNLAAYLVFAAALFFSTASSLVGISKEASTDNELFQERQNIINNLEKIKNTQLAAMQLELKGSIAKNDAEVQRLYMKDIAKILSVFDTQIEEATKEYNRQKNIRDSKGNINGSALEEAKLRLQEQIAARAKYYDESPARIQSAKDSKNKQLRLDYLEISKAISDNHESEEKEQLALLDNNQSAYGINNKISELATVLSELFNVVAGISVSFIVTKSIVVLMVTILLEGGFYLMAHKYFSSIETLSSIDATSFDADATYEEFKSQIKKDHATSLKRDAESFNTKTR